VREPGGIATGGRAAGAVQRLPGRVDDPPDPAVIRRDLGLSQKLHPITDGHPVAGGIRQDRTAPRREAQHLAPGDLVAAVDQHPVTDRRSVQPGYLGQPASRLRHPPDPPHGSTSGDFRQETIEKTSHGILPLFALHRF
jgi:hypothetical protein